MAQPKIIAEQLDVGIGPNQIVVRDENGTLTITESDVTQHEGALTITESQISDLGNYTLVGHTHSTGDITSGTFADARIAQSNVTQHEGALNHDALTNFVANEHINHTSVSISGGTGLSGGGDISASRTLNLDINGLTVDGSPDGASDYVATYDASAGTHKKVLLNNIGGSGGGFNGPDDSGGEPVIDTTALDIDSSITSSTWTSVGPTGSGASVVWSALDSIPTSANWIRIRIYGTLTASGGVAGSLYSGVVHTRRGGSSAAAAFSNTIWRAAGRFNANGDDATDGNVTEATIQVDGSNIFDLYWVANNFAAAAYVVAYG